MKTTLNAIRKHKPCTDGWENLLSYLGKTKADDEPLSLLTILDSNGIDDAIWCLRAVEGYDRGLRLFAVWCARQVQHLLTDQRSIDALDVAERYANGQATEDELTAAAEAAWSAARNAAEAAWSAEAAARNATWTARAAAWSAATWTAAEAAWSAARAAARNAAEAAWSAARAAEAAARGDARAAARAAAWAAEAAARNADVWAAAVAEQEMGIRQAAELRRICEED